MRASDEDRPGGARTEGEPDRAAPARGLLKERAYRALKEGILRGDFPAGTFLSERRLADRLEMSKTPIRAAIERLELEGFVRVAPQQGIVVREPGIPEIADQFEIREALESFVVRALAGRLTADQAARLRANLEAHRATIAPRDVGRCVGLDTEFHLMFCEFLGNREILRVMLHLRDAVHRVIVRVYERDEARLATSFGEHREIAEAVIRGDAEAAARGIVAHLEYGKRSMLSSRGG